MTRNVLALPATPSRHSPEEIARAKAILREAEARKLTEAEQVAEQVALAADLSLIASGWEADNYEREWTDPPDEPIDPRDLTYFRDIHAGGLDLLVVIESVCNRFVDEGRRAFRGWRVEVEGSCSGQEAVLEGAAVEAEIAAANFAVAILRALPADVRTEAMRQLVEASK